MSQASIAAVVASKQHHEAYVVEHLTVLSDELLQWRKTGLLREGSMLGALAETMARGMADESDAYQMAEHLVTLMALRRAAGHI